MKLNPTNPLRLCALFICLLLSQACMKTQNVASVTFDESKAQLHVISITQATAYTSAFRQAKMRLAVQLRDSSFLSSGFSLPFAEEFNKDALVKLLNQPGAKGMRIYLGKTSTGLVNMVLIAVDSTGKDITSDGVHHKTGFALEAGQRCPTICSPQSPLY